jgi:hypothetical protein
MNIEKSELFIKSYDKFKYTGWLHDENEVKKIFLENGFEIDDSENFINFSKEDCEAIYFKRGYIHIEMQIKGESIISFYRIDAVKHFMEFTK